MKALLLNNEQLEMICGGLSPKSNGVAAIDAFVDATGVLPLHRVSNAVGDPAAGKALPFPAALDAAYNNFPN